MNSLVPPTNPSETYRAQLAALIQLGRPIVEKIPDKVATTIGTQCALVKVGHALLQLQVELLKEEVGGTHEY